MCICNYTLSEIANEEMSIHEVFQATVDDFNRTVDYLKEHPFNEFYLKHLYDLIVFMQRDECFSYMETDLDVFIAVALGAINMTFGELVTALRKIRKISEL